MEPDDYKKIIEDQGFDVEYNPPGDGSCQFAALAHQLSALGIFRSAETMRREIVGYLEKNAVDNEGFPLLEFLPEFTSWEEYLRYMAKSNTFGDQITLFAAANLYNINIQVISTLGPGAQHLFEPSSSVPLGTVYLGHFAAGEHYVSPLPWFSDSGSDGPECDSGSGEATKGVGRSGEDPCTAGFDKISRRDTGSNGESGEETAADRKCDGNTNRSGGNTSAGGSGGNISSGGSGGNTSAGGSGGNTSAGGRGGNTSAAGSGGNTSAAGSRGKTGGDGDSGGDRDELPGYSQQFLNNDVLESIIKITLITFPHMRSSLRAVNTFFRETVDKIPCPTVYIPELAKETIVISIRKLVILKGKCSSAVERLREVINSPCSRKFHKSTKFIQPSRSLTKGYDSLKKSNIIEQ